MFGSVEFLRKGTERQRLAYRTLSDLAILDVLARYHPTLVGTIPIDLDVDASDLDIICEAYDLDEFERDVAHAYGRFRGFEIHRTELKGVLSSVSNFETEDFPIQIFAQGVPIHRQRAFRHLVAEARLLRLAGGEAKASIRVLREQGMKTEPAFGEYFCLDGDPYEKLYAIAEASDQDLQAIIETAARVRARQSP